MSNRNQKTINKYFNTSKKKAPVSKTKLSRKKTKQRDNKTQTEVDNELLKDFDLNWIFGPCSGLPRLDRWERASKFSLHPPQEIKDLILKNSANRQYTKCIWDQNLLLQPMTCDS